MANHKEKEIAELIAKAVDSKYSSDALRFSQAACNVANAMNCMNQLTLNNRYADRDCTARGQTLDDEEADFLVWLKKLKTKYPLENL